MDSKTHLNKVAFLPGAGHAIPFFRRAYEYIRIHQSGLIWCRVTSELLHAGPTQQARETSGKTQVKQRLSVPPAQFVSELAPPVFHTLRHQCFQRRYVHCFCSRTNRDHCTHKHVYAEMQSNKQKRNMRTRIPRARRCSATLIHQVHHCKLSCYCLAASCWGSE